MPPTRLIPTAAPGSRSTPRRRSTCAGNDAQRERLLTDDWRCGPEGGGRHDDRAASSTAFLREDLASGSPCVSSLSERPGRTLSDCRSDERRPSEAEDRQSPSFSPEFGERPPPSRFRSRSGRRRESRSPIRSAGRCRSCIGPTGGGATNRTDRCRRPVERGYVLRWRPAVPPKQSGFRWGVNPLGPPTARRSRMRFDGAGAA